MGSGPKPPRSLKARALQWLAQREHSRTELRRKLMRLAVAELALAEGAVIASAAPCARATAPGTARVDGEQAAPQPPEPAARVDALLDWLEAHQYLSQDRFVESRVHARLARFGNLRICQELKQHHVALPADAARELADTELQRARAVRQRKFAEPPVSAAERARQGRFLAGRGFSPEVIQRVLREPAPASDDA
ncbi:MAG: RecX family transcriptional regulator [Burkholderiales bacterium]|nr:RecX family transcriptional regulator [Burkholderiales bacterium]